MKKTTDTDLAKRKLLKKIGLGVGAAIAIPMISSFSKDGLFIGEAVAKKGAKKGGPKK